MRGDRSPARPSRREEYWDWVAVALFLWLAVDLLASLSAASVVGLEHETNPVTAWPLGRHLAVVVAVHRRSRRIPRPSRSGLSTSE